MKTDFFSSYTSHDDMVFENRNKMYGAYELRKTYEERLTLATMASVSFFMLMISSLYIFSSTTPEIPDIPIQPTKGTIKLDEVPVITLPEPPRMFQKPIEDAEIIPEITKDKTPITDVTKPNPAVPSTSSGTGDPNGNDIIPGSGTLNGTGTPALPITPPAIIPEPNTDFIDHYDKAPEFMGGHGAYERYLQDHIIYPDVAIRNNVQGTIYLMVKINEKGKVVDVEVMKGIGAGCDDEAKRVIKNMPAWKPGEQNGRAVSVKCVLRVKMLLQN